MAYQNYTYCGACLKVSTLSSSFLYEHHLDDAFMEIATEFFMGGKGADIVILIPNDDNARADVCLPIADMGDFVEMNPSTVDTLIANFSSAFEYEISQIRDIIGKNSVDVVFMVINYLQ